MNHSVQHKAGLCFSLLSFAYGNFIWHSKTCNGPTEEMHNSHVQEYLKHVIYLSHCIDPDFENRILRVHARSYKRSDVSTLIAHWESLPNIPRQVDLQLEQSPRKIKRHCPNGQCWNISQGFLTTFFTALMTETFKVSFMDKMSWFSLRVFFASLGCLATPSM